MNANIPATARTSAVAANLTALHALLLSAAARSAEAQTLIEGPDNNCNGAIGTILGLDDVLDSAKSLYTAALTLHRLK